MTPRQWGFAATATAAMLVPALLHTATPIDWFSLADPDGVEAVPPGPGDVLGTLALDAEGKLGATGQLPETDELSAALLADADDPSEFEDDLPPLEGGFLREGQHGIPGVMLDAYMRAADRLGQTTPGCRLDWPLLASIGRIESGHAHGGRVTESGTTVERIVGPVLNGAPGVAAIRDTDGGKFDGDRTWDRAVGPMQFIPSTWAGYAADGNEDGERNPNNIYDATIGAGNYLCANNVDVSDPVQRARSVFRYNQSNEYVATVLYWADVYANGVPVLPDIIGSDDDFRPSPGDDTPSDHNNASPPGNTTPPSSSTANPTTTTTPTTTWRPGVTITFTPSVPTRPSTTTTTPTCPTEPAEPTGTTTSTPTTTPTTTPSIPPGCPTPTTTTTTTTTEAPATTPVATTSAGTSPAGTSEGTSSTGSGSSYPSSSTSSMKAT
ncbi:lytic transglycosylase domain-containing protein [Saccharothrix texasensis]|uniref:Transglycosylase protein with SLT domain n=1 Tax=Saccharothrix texasensis TaxID=103734 RepID=A0A3N1H7L0_9PSEU|nr:lytic transglycosylase domain-containing protein [Saccharothrix texasensis]ROP38534.1 transglycosylase protein with SLT domain [Saccharothrix texasensis]